MTMTEQTGRRDLSYSAWHRPASIGRYLNGFNKDKHRIKVIDGPWCEYSDPYRRTPAEKLGMIDIDHLLVDGKHWRDRGPVALIESARTYTDIPFEKIATLTAILGKQANLPVYVVLYKVADTPNPAQPECNDIEMFFVRQYWPQKMKGYIQMAPQEYAHFLVWLRQNKGNHMQLPLDPRWTLINETEIRTLCMNWEQI